RYAQLAGLAGTLDVTAIQLIQTVRAYSVAQGKRLDARRAKTRASTKKAQAILLTKHQAADLKRRHPDTPRGHRDAALICLLTDLGLRGGEVQLLRVEHFSLDERRGSATVTFDRPKVQKRQTHRLSREALVALRRYLADRRQLAQLGAGETSEAGGNEKKEERGAGGENGVSGTSGVSGPLLCATWPHRQDLVAVGLSTRAIRARVRQLGKQILGIPNLSPHDLRHYWATAAVRNGTDLKTLQEAGGWNSPAMPMWYAKVGAIVNEGIRLDQLDDLDVDADGEHGDGRDDVERVSEEDSLDVREAGEARNAGKGRAVSAYAGYRQH
ncbi:MAG TPA: tyrosine-type recombinase/integrase, partial [Ktedonobacterales bacterium]